MKANPIVILFITAILIAGFFYWQTNIVKVDRSAELYRVIGPVFLKYGLTDNNLINKTVEENRLGDARYVSACVEYNAPKTFMWRKFDTALRMALKKTGFSIFDAERSLKKDGDRFTVIINFGRFDILTLIINRKGEPVTTVVEKKYNRPKVAIVVDDFGYSKNNLEQFLNLKEPVTISILPGQRFSREVAKLSKARGFEVILHLPLESTRADVVAEVDTIKTVMGEKEMILRLGKEISMVPGIDGVNNHMGSKATADTAVMTTILKYLKSRNLYFLDSLTTNKSVCMNVARTVGVKFAKRDLFLDNSNNTAAIEKQLADLKAMAFKRGEAIAICHDRKNTAAVLARVMPEMAGQGIEFVRLSELVKR